MTDKLKKDIEAADVLANLYGSCSASTDMESLRNLYLVWGKDNYTEETMYVIAFDAFSAVTIAGKRWQSIRSKHVAWKVELIATQNHYDKTGFLCLDR